MIRSGSLVQQLSTLHGPSLNHCESSSLRMKSSNERLTHFCLTSTGVVYESSSLPFIFGGSSPGSGSGSGSGSGPRCFKGRRKFVNGQEQDVVPERSSQPLEANSDVRERRIRTSYLYRCAIRNLWKHRRRRNGSRKRPKESAGNKLKLQRISPPQIRLGSLFHLTSQPLQPIL
jgi:hypothetical protein